MFPLPFQFMAMRLIPATATLVIQLLLCVPLTARADGYNLPEQVKVLPVAFVPEGETVPSQSEQTLFLRHLNWSREQYAELLEGDTFELA